MFGHRYFGERYFGERYFGPHVDTTPPLPSTAVGSNLSGVMSASGRHQRLSRLGGRRRNRYRRMR